MTEDEINLLRKEELAFLSEEEDKNGCVQMEPPEKIVKLAIRAAAGGECLSLRGAVLFYTDEEFEMPDGFTVVSTGFNHQPYGFSCSHNNFCKTTCGRTAIHAEQDALAFTSSEETQMLHVKVSKVKDELTAIAINRPYQSIWMKDHYESYVLESSGKPSCLECSKLMIRHGVKYMWLYQDEKWFRYSTHRFHKETLNQKIDYFFHPKADY